MLELIRETLRKYILQALLALVLLPAGIYSAVSLLFPFGSEIVYEMNMVFSTCSAFGAKPTGQCTGRAEFLIGNTGHTDVAVDVAWPRFQGHWSRDHNVLDISADRPRSRDPDVHCAVDAGRQECSFDPFTAGALVIMHFDCYRCSKHELEMLEGTPLEIRADAHVSHGDPRVTLLLRRLMALARLFM